MKAHLDALHVMEENRPKGDFLRKKAQHTRIRWHEKTVSLNFERDSSKLWNLTTVLNEEASSGNKTVLHVNTQLLTEKTAENEFTELYRAP